MLEEIEKPGIVNIEIEYFTPMVSVKPAIITNILRKEKF